MCAYAEGTNYSRVYLSATRLTCEALLRNVTRIRPLGLRSRALDPRERDFISLILCAIYLLYSAIGYSFNAISTKHGHDNF